MIDVCTTLHVFGCLLFSLPAIFFSSPFIPSTHEHIAHTVLVLVIDVFCLRHAGIGPFTRYAEIINGRYMSPACLDLFHNHCMFISSCVFLCMFFVVLCHIATHFMHRKTDHMPSCFGCTLCARKVERTVLQLLMHVFGRAELLCLAMWFWHMWSTTRSCARQQH